MPSSHLILGRPLFLLPLIPPSIRVFSNESALRMRWPNIGVSASASVLPMNTQAWSPSGWTGWISFQSKGLSRIFSNTTVQKHQFFGAQLFSQSNSHIHTWPLGKWGQKGIQEIKVFSHWHQNSTFNVCTCFSLWNLSVGLFFETEYVTMTVVSVFWNEVTLLQKRVTCYFPLDPGLYKFWPVNPWIKVEISWEHRRSQPGLQDFQRACFLLVQSYSEGRIIWVPIS